MRKMKKQMISGLICVLFLVGCAAPQTKTDKGAVYGATGGAAAGAVLGQVIGGDTKSTLFGAVIGAALGGAGGYAVGKKMDDQEKSLRDAVGSSDKTSVTRKGNLLELTFKGDEAFDSGSAVVKPSIYPEIDRVANILNQYPDSLILVEGHTDSKGSEAFNKDLSMRRANAVKDLLTQRGVPATRIEVAGLGEAMPIATNDTEAGRQKNRRVEIKIAPQAQEKAK
jgi:outer membrane protein OmpA-like peptidoglycan-associated protein